MKGRVVRIHFGLCAHLLYVWRTATVTVFVCVELVRGEKLITATVQEMLIALAGCSGELQASLPPLHGPGSHY